MTPDPAGLGKHRVNAAQRALAHPVRARLLTELRRGPRSPSQLAEIVGESIGTTSYHVRMLCDAGLAKLVGTQPKRGAIQHFYVACDDHTVGVTLRLDAAHAERLQREPRERVAEAQRAADEHAGDVTVTIIVHAEGA